MSNDLPVEVRNNINNGNFCGLDYYVKRSENAKEIQEQCMKCPPGKDEWYFQERSEKIPPNTRLTDTQLNQLKQCSGGSTVTPDFIRTLDPNFRETDASGEPTWKSLQQSENVKHCAVDPLSGKVTDNETCQRDSIDKPATPPDTYETQFKLFTDCINKNVSKIDDEFQLVNQLKELSMKDINHCLETLPPADICDQGYSEMYTSVPSIYLKQNGITQLSTKQQTAYDRTIRQLSREAYVTESSTCGNVTSKTASMNNISNDQIKDVYPSLPISQGVSVFQSFVKGILDFIVSVLEEIGIWPENNTSVRQLIVIATRVAIFTLVIMAILYMTSSMKSHGGK